MGQERWRNQNEYGNWIRPFGKKENFTGQIHGKGDPPDGDFDVDRDSFENFSTNDVNLSISVPLFLPPPLV